MKEKRVRRLWLSLLVATIVLISWIAWGNTALELNEYQIKSFLKENKNFECIEERQYLPTEGLDGFYVCKMIKRSI